MANFCKRCQTAHGDDGTFCSACAAKVSEAMAVPTIAVDMIGDFAGGSFGSDGNPSKRYAYWTVRGPFNRGNFPDPKYTFRSEFEGHCPEAAKKLCAAERAKAWVEAKQRVADLGVKWTDAEAMKREAVA